MCLRNNMNNSDYINGILRYIRGISSINYQNAVGCILSIYYEGTKTFEMPSPYGGDDKNDGWVVEDALFYQIFSPIQFSSSFASEIANKFEEDLDSLINLVYQKNKWNGIIKQFIFLVNTRDTSLPKDPNRRYDKIRDKLIRKYGIKNNIITSIVNDDYLFNLLYQMNSIQLDKLVIKLNIQGLVNVNKTSSLDIITFIDKIAENLGNSILCAVSTNYTRISSDKKIAVNSLMEKKDRILQLIPRLSIVDDAIGHFNKSPETIEVFEKVRDLYICAYTELMKTYNSSELYDKIIEKVLDFAPELKAFSIPAELILVYIFDRCDIFEKEELLEA